MNENKQFIFLLCLIIFHVYVVIGNLLAFFIVPFLCPWYVALPICSLIVTLSFGRGSDCPLTRLENKIRKNIGLRRIKGFIKHYFYEIWK
mgnify:CR=1 FL=1